MIKANFNTYNTYVTDSLYQWDLDRDLIINGLNLSVAPEIHFANANMDRAIVRQSFISSGVITVRIPNSLLQEALTIKAYVGVYKGTTFKVIETIEIPVIAKARPSDYSLTDTDEEIYSFIRLENMIANAIEDFEDKCDETLVELEASVEATTRALSARINNIISNNDSVEGNSELVDIRVSSDGTTHSSAGDAVRAVEKKANIGLVFTNKAPIVEYVEEESVTLTLKGTTHIFYGDDGRYDVPETTVSYNMNGTPRYIFKILFDIVTNTINLKHSMETIPDGNVLLGFIYKNVVKLNTWVQSDESTPYPDTTIFPNTWTDEAPIFEASGLTYTITFPTAVHLYYDRLKAVVNATSITFTGTSTNYLYYLLADPISSELSIISHKEAIPGGYVAFGLFHIKRGVILFGQGAKHTKALTPASLIIGYNKGEKYVEFDSVNKTVTFPDDTVIVANTEGLNTYITLANSKGNTVADWSELSTSAICLYYNRYTKLLECKRYDAVVDGRYILLCSFRTYNGSVAISVPYRWDGKLFNTISTTDTGSNITRNYNVKAVNHRGYSSEAPENTLSAYRLSKLKGFDYAECDVAFTSDNVAVLLHDGTVDRTSDGTGNIGDLTLEEVKALDFGSWFSSAYAGEQIPTFEEFIILCRNIGLYPYIEIKNSATYTESQIKSLVDMVKRVGMRGKVTWISFTSEYLGYVKNYDDEARLGYLVSDITSSVINTALELKTDSNEVFIDSTYSVLTEEKVALCINADLPLEAWTINDSSIIASLDPYVSGVTSDNLIAGEVLYNANID